MADSRSELSLAIVEALAAWSAVEIELAQLFAILADFPTAPETRFNRKAHLIFDAILAFDIRLAIVNALMAAEDSFSELEREMWACCSKRLKKLYKRRHPLAHFIHYGTPDGDVNMIAPFFTIGAAMRNQVKSLDIPQIKERNEHFVEAHQAICYFEVLLPMNRGQWSGHPMQEIPLVARFRETASQILEERKRQPQAAPEQGEQED